MAKPSLTLLQRTVIQRLHEAGLDGIAEFAKDNWSLGQRIPGHSRPESMDPRNTQYHVLLDDFERANEQADSTAVED
ncbi:MAG TPA: hypothetical protein VGH98_08595 [Gemmatimonadaceae bacterium]